MSVCTCTPRFSVQVFYRRPQPGSSQFETTLALKLLVRFSATFGECHEHLMPQLYLRGYPEKRLCTAASGARGRHMFRGQDVNGTDLLRRCFGKMFVKAFGRRSEDLVSLAGLGTNAIIQEELLISTWDLELK